MNLVVTFYALFINTKRHSLHESVNTHICKTIVVLALLFAIALLSSGLCIIILSFYTVRFDRFIYIFELIFL